MPLDYYRLSEKPFELSPDLKFLYLTSGYREALRSVQDGIIDLRGLMVLTGEAGTGKTMLIYGLMGGLPGHIKTAFIFHSTFSFNEILSQIFSELGEPQEPGEKQDLKSKFLDYLGKLRDRGEILAVFIDEAQKLSPEVLRGFFHFLEGDPWISGTLQLVFAGQAELENLLNTVAASYLRLRSPVRARIPILTPEESLAYIEYRLSTAGGALSEIFTPRAVSAIIEYSRGIPRLINVVCDNALFNGCADSLEKIDLKTIQKVIRNLEGPGGVIDIKARAIKAVSPKPFWSRLSARLALGFLVVMALTGIALIWWRFDEGSLYLKNSDGPLRVVDSQIDPGKNVRPQPESPKLPEAGQPARPSLNFPVSGEEPAPAVKKTPVPLRIRAKAGESLSILAQRHYGKMNESLINLITLYNPAIKKLDLILVDQEIKLPELGEEALIIKGPDQGYTIFLGIFTNSRMVQEYKNQSALKGKRITVQPNIFGKKQRGFRFEAGNFESRVEALEALKALRQKNLLPFF